ncbi:MAG TPA: hypothetical protein VFO41_08695 [Alphaproteobacteria bacterium]|nr:hypothetical protein [Alphaproteobacteria bacterium]
MRFMPALPAVDRAFDVLSPIAVFRPVGRRPSGVYVDAARTAAQSTTARHRLNDVVYRRIQAEPGDQIQDCSGGMLLVTEAGACHPVRLAPPQPLEAETAFRHAQIAAEADRAAAGRFVAEGRLAEAAKARRPTSAPAHPNRNAAVLPEDHPLVIAETG